MARSGPPAYAWDWFARQRLLWREVRVRLAATEGPVGDRYGALDARPEVLTLLRADYPQDASVRSTVDAVVAELVFLGRTDVPFARLGLRSSPRGLRWWWTALTGEDPDAAPTQPDAGTPPPAQLSLDDLADDRARLAMDEVHEGYGG